MFERIKKLITAMKQPNYKKEEYRGAIKQFMKVRGLRSISIENYNRWKNLPSDGEIHSIKLDIMNGYVNAYGYGYTRGGRLVCASDAVLDGSEAFYHRAYDKVKAILADEQNIPYRVRKNILVRVSR